MSNIDQYIKYLEKVKILLSDNIYQVGKKSKYYKINEDYLKGLHTQIEIEPKTRLHTKITEDIRRKRAHYSRLEPHLSVMQKELLKLDFDYTGALKWINENAKGEVKKMSYINSIQALKDKRFRYFKRNNKNKRLDTNITNLKGELKQFIKGDHTVIDVCNSQPFLLAILIENIINNNRDTYCCYLQEETIVKTFGIKRIKRISIFNQNEEKQDLVNFSMFYNSVLNGSLYEDFIAHYGNGVNRKDVKIILFKVLFSSNKKQNLIPFKDEKNVFKSVYPFIYDCIYNFKKDDKKNNLLPIYLQRLESYLFIDCIAKELVQNGIVPLTVHDSVIIPTKYKEKALDIIKGVVLKELGVMPSFNIESLKPLPNELRLAI
ncbi:MAG: hypothetical protein KDD41_06395 [Flavobacteriales bacterium]|nr:hypothetical protein [Flavobacteriales bacterium]